MIRTPAKKGPKISRRTGDMELPETITWEPQDVGGGGEGFEKKEKERKTKSHSLAGKSNCFAGSPRDSRAGLQGWETKTRQHESHSARGLCTVTRCSQPGAFSPWHQLSKCFIRLLWMLPESCGQAAETGTVALDLNGHRARAGSGGTSLQAHQAIGSPVRVPCLPQFCQGHTRASASRGIWKHLKLPTGRPGALSARPTEGWSTIQILPRNQLTPHECTWPISNLAGTPFKSMGAAKCQEDQHHQIHLLRRTGQASNQLLWG